MENKLFICILNIYDRSVHFISANTFIATGPIPIKLCMLMDSQTPFSSNKNETSHHPALIVQ